MFQTKHGSIAEMINKRILMNLGKGTVALRVNRTGLLLKPRYWKQSVKCTHMETMLVAAMTFGRLTSCVQPTVSTVTLSVAYQPPLGKHFEPCHVWTTPGLHACPNPPHDQRPGCQQIAERCQNGSTKPWGRCPPWLRRLLPQISSIVEAQGSSEISSTIRSNDAGFP